MVHVNKAKVGSISYPAIRFIDYFIGSFHRAILNARFRIHFRASTCALNILVSNAEALATHPSTHLRNYVRIKQTGSVHTRALS